jgi:hypothetical protein
MFSVSKFVLAGIAAFSAITFVASSPAPALAELTVKPRGTPASDVVTILTDLKADVTASCSALSS